MKRIVSVCLVISFLLGVMVQPVSAQSAPSPRLRWSHLIRTGVSFTIDDSNKLEFSASCRGSDTAQYTIMIYLMNLDGEMLAGPIIDGPRAEPFTGGTYTVTEPGGYYAVAVFYAIVDGQIAEGALLESEVIYV